VFFEFPSSAVRLRAGSGLRPYFPDNEVPLPRSGFDDRYDPGDIL